MKKPRDSHLGFRMDKETHDKLFYIAEYEGRTGSGQILYLIRRCITEFEQVHGKIRNAMSVPGFPRVTEC